MRQACAAEEDGSRKKQGHGAQIKEPLDDINGKLRADRQACLARHQPGARQISNAANQRHAREADHLRAEQGQRSHRFVGANEQSPAQPA